MFQVPFEERDQVLRPWPRMGRKRGGARWLTTTPTWRFCLPVFLGPIDYFPSAVRPGPNPAIDPLTRSHPSMVAGNL